MSMHDAFAFVAACKNDGEFRSRLYQAGDREEFRRGLAAEGFSVTDAEIEDSFRALELRASCEEEASEIKELGQWYRLVSHGSSSGCAGCHSGKR
jgi:predicted ribosomally synthesized peptide with nif11-like leader